MQNDRTNGESEDHQADQVQKLVTVSSDHVRLVKHYPVKKSGSPSFLRLELVQCGHQYRVFRVTLIALSYS